LCLANEAGFEALEAEGKDRKAVWGVNTNNSTDRGKTLRAQLHALVPAVQDIYARRILITSEMDVM
jgi:hypothetical protein